MLFKSILIVFLFPLFLLGEQYEPLLPRTEGEVAQFVEDAKAQALATVAQVKAIGAEQRSAANTMKPLNQLVSDLIGAFSVLMYMQQSGQRDTEKELAELTTFLSQSLMQDPALPGVLLDYAKQALDGKKTLSPYDHYELQCLLESCKPMQGTLNEEGSDLLDDLLAENRTHAQTPFLYLRGEAAEKTCDVSFPEEGVSVLSLNTCFIPHRYPILFGGVYLPWQERIAAVAERILSVDADVVCLQEVHAEQASLVLYEALRHRYTHFYGAIGQRFFGLSASALGLPSGLFIASKYPLERPRFTVFPVSGFAMNYGFFDCVIPHRAHVYATHMQSLDHAQFPQIRCAQFQLIVDAMRTDRETESLPGLLCGDLNVPYGSEEPSVALIRAHFIDAYNRHTDHVDETNSTCCNYFTNHYLAPHKKLEEIDPEFQILDYALLLKPTEYALQTSRVRMNDLGKPLEALSDHHALLTILSRPQMRASG